MKFKYHKEAIEKYAEKQQQENRIYSIFPLLFLKKNEKDDR
jgi:hypothetical protein